MSSIWWVPTAEMPPRRQFTHVPPPQSRPHLSSRQAAEDVPFAALRRGDDIASAVSKMYDPAGTGWRDITDPSKPPLLVKKGDLRLSVLWFWNDPESHGGLPSASVCLVDRTQLLRTSIPASLLFPAASALYAAPNQIDAGSATS